MSEYTPMQHNPDPSIVDVYHRIGGIEAKVDQLLATSTETKTHAARIEDRIASLEHNRTWIKGGLWAISGLFGMIGVYIGRVFHG